MTLQAERTWHSTHHMVDIWGVFLLITGESSPWIQGWGYKVSYPDPKLTLRVQTKEFFGRCGDRSWDEKGVSKNLVTCVYESPKQKECHKYMQRTKKTVGNQWVERSRRDIIYPKGGCWWLLDDSSPLWLRAGL
jgi:hypothetical protein